MGHYFLIAECIGCGKVFTCNPDLVPSITVKGVKEPVCKDCFDRRQAHRKEHRLPIETHHPLAYEEAPDGWPSDYDFIEDDDIFDDDY